MSSRKVPARPERTVDLAGALAATPPADGILAELRAIAPLIDRANAALDELYARRLALWKAARADSSPLTFKAIADASGCSDAMVVQTLKKASTAAG